MTNITAASHPIVETEDGGREQRWPLPADEQSLLDLIHVCFDEYWDEIWFGTLIEGAAWEVAAPNPPTRISMYDGYATVDFGRWHFHLCIGEHRGTTASPCPQELADHRRVKRAALFRTWGRSCVPASWGLRLWNGHGEQMITVFFPNPYLDEKGHRPRHPDWSRLYLWDLVRREFLGLEPDPSDRQKGLE